MKKFKIIFLLLIILYPRIVSAAEGKKCIYDSNGVNVIVNITVDKKKNLNCSATIKEWPDINSINKSVNCGLWSSETKNSYLATEISSNKELCPTYILVSYKKGIPLINIGEKKELYISYSKSILENQQKKIKNKSYIIENTESKEVLDKKGSCTEYTYEECVNKTDAQGNVCIKDTEKKICKRPSSCADYITKESCPSLTDSGRCRWNDTTNKCEKKNLFICTDYLTKDQCKERDEEGKECRWRKGKCTFKNSKDDPNKEEKEDLDLETNDIDCDNIFNGKFGTLLKQILSLIRFAVPILIIGLSVVDFIKALAAQDPNEIKKVTNKLGKRLIIGVLIFLLPTLLEVLLELAGIEFGVCDIK